jgi:nicotinamidase/pyrazinamidase
LSASSENEKDRWLRDGTALVVVDVQNDFCPGGALPVPRGDDIIPVLNRLADVCWERHLPVFYTRDWHPPGHCSFAPQGGPWPDHCVRDTEGAAFHPGLAVGPNDIIVSKAVEVGTDAYSGFQDTRLGERMRKMGIARLIIGGLATEYCVKATVLDGLQEGFDVAVLRDGIAGIEVKPGDCERAFAEMDSAGAVLLDAAALMG